MFIISGQFRVKPAYRTELIEMCLALLQPSRQESGCLSYSFYADQASENQFLFFERWRDRASIDAHFAKPYFKDFAARFPAMIEADAEIDIYAIKHVEKL